MCGCGMLEEAHSACDIGLASTVRQVMMHSIWAKPYQQVWSGDWRQGTYFSSSWMTFNNKSVKRRKM